MLSNLFLPVTSYFAIFCPGGQQVHPARRSPRDDPLPLGISVAHRWRLPRVYDRAGRGDDEVGAHLQQVRPLHQERI